MIRKRYFLVRRSCGLYRYARQVVNTTRAECVKPLLTIETDIDILSGQPFNKVIARGVYRRTAGASFAHPYRLLLVLFVLGCYNLYGTSALAIRTNAFLVVGTDSVRTSPTSAEQVCKIRRSGLFFITLAGLVEYPGSSYDPYAVATHAIARCQTIGCATSNFERAIKAPLTEVLTRIRRYNEAYFIAHYRTRAPLQGMIYRRDGVSSAIRAFNINVDTTKPGAELIFTTDGGCPGPACPEGTYMSAIGHYSHAVGPAMAPLKTGEANNFAVALGLIKRGLIDEAKATPEDVGPPYSILVIEGGNIRWQEGYQGACPDIDK